MNYIAERRLEEKERRRVEILDAAESVAASVGWEQMTMDQVARKARLSRALLYVYFKDKTDLMFGINARALSLLRQRFTEVVEHKKRGLDQVEGFGRAYIAVTQEFPVYFEVLSRCELVTTGEIDLNTNEGQCLTNGSAVFAIMETALETGFRDGSISREVGPPNLVSIVLWGFMHGVIQFASNKSKVLMHRGIEGRQLLEQALSVAIRAVTQGATGSGATDPGTGK